MKNKNEEKRRFWWDLYRPHCLTWKECRHIYKMNYPNWLGFVYFIYDPSICLVKIGRSVNPFQKVEYLRRQQHESCYLLFALKVSNCVKAETYFHRKFSEKREKLDTETEWFALSVDDMSNIILSGYGDRDFAVLGEIFLVEEYEEWMEKREERPFLVLSEQNLENRLLFDENVEYIEDYGFYSKR